MISQAYDGAANMSGKRNGVQVILRPQSPHSVYSWCRGHRLNLASVQASKDVALIHRVHGTLLTLWKLFYYSPLKAAKLREVQKLLQTTQLKMAKPSDTRWLAIGRQTEVVYNEYPAILATLDAIYEEDGDAAANGCARLLRQFDHLAAVHLLNEALNILNVLSKSLQGTTQNVCKISTLVNSTIQRLQQLLVDPPVASKGCGES